MVCHRHLLTVTKYPNKCIMYVASVFVYVIDVPMFALPPSAGRSVGRKVRWHSWRTCCLAIRVGPFPTHKNRVCSHNNRDLNGSYSCLMGFVCTLTSCPACSSSFFSFLWQDDHCPHPRRNLELGREPPAKQPPQRGRTKDRHIRHAPVDASSSFFWI